MNFCSSGCCYGNKTRNCGPAQYWKKSALFNRFIERKLTFAKREIGFDDQDQIKGLERNELIELLRILD